MPKRLQMIGFAGPSAAGKTTLLEALVRTLEQRGLSVGVVKHSCHQVYIDQPGKDSARLYDAGADAVALAAQNQIVTFVRQAMPPRLGDALMSLPIGLDVVLVEGFAWERLPRYLVLPEGFTDVARYTKNGPILGTLIARSLGEAGELLFSPRRIEALASEISSLIGRDRPTDPVELQ